MIQNMRGKIEDILQVAKKINIDPNTIPSDLVYPDFPDKNQKTGKICSNFIKLLRLFQENKTISKNIDIKIDEIHNCCYSVTTKDQDSSAGSMEIQENEFNDCKKKYTALIDRLHSAVNRYRF